MSRRNRPVVLALAATLPLVACGALALARAGVAFQPGHRADADPALGVLAAWRSRF
jgi:hypothetical protein